MKKERTVAKALAFSPLAAPALYFVGAFIFGGGTDWGMRDFIALLTLVLFIAAPVSYVAVLVFGVPYFRVLSRFDLLSCLSLVAGGVFFGVLTFLIFWVSPWGLGVLSSLSMLELARLVIIGAVLGGGVAICFAYIAGITSRSTRTRAKNARAC